MFYDNQLNSYDIGSVQQDAWNDGFEDGMNEIISMVDIFKRDYMGNPEFQKLIEELEEYINENKPRRDS